MKEDENKMKTSWGWAGRSSAQVEALLADKVKVMIHLWALLVKLNNFTFGNKAVLCLESTILDGRPACRPAWRSWKYNHLSPKLELKLGLGLSLAMWNE